MDKRALQLFLRETGRRWAESIFPPVCVICQQSFSKVGDTVDICPLCLSDLPWRRRSEAILPLLSNRLRREIGREEWERANTVKVLVPLFYSGEIPHLIRNLKFHGKLEAARPLASLMTTAVRLHPLAPFDAVVAVPLHARRMRERAYNQADELAKVIASELRMADLSFSMKRVVHTQRQSELAYALRTENLKNAFEVDPGVLRKRHVLVVDDILTSGATLWSAVQAVQASGPASVTGLVVASGRKTEVN